MKNSKQKNLKNKQRYKKSYKKINSKIKLPEFYFTIIID